MDPLPVELDQSRQIGRYEQVYSTRHHKAGMWSRSRRLGLEVISRPIKASASVSVSSRTDWRTPWSRSRNQGSRSWYRSWTVRPGARVIFGTYAIFLFIQNALRWSQPSVLFTQLNSLPCHRPLRYSIHLTNTVFKSKQILSSSFLLIIS